MLVVVIEARNLVMPVWYSEEWNCVKACARCSRQLSPLVGLQLLLGHAKLARNKRHANANHAL